MQRTSALCLLLLLLVASAVAQGGRPAFASDCERGVLDAGEDGMNVLVYELCDDRLTVGFESSDVIEEITCEPDGDVQLWMSADHERCAAQPAADAPWVYDLLEPLQGVGRTTSAPVTQAVEVRRGDDEPGHHRHPQRPRSTSRDAGRRHDLRAGDAAVHPAVCSAGRVASVERASSSRRVMPMARRNASSWLTTSSAPS